jgi:hypothetical protein
MSEAAAVANLTLSLVFGLVLIAPAWRIFRRTGLAGAWSLLVFLPGFGPIAAIVVLAFVPGRHAAKGSRRRERDRRRQRPGAGPDDRLLPMQLVLRRAGFHPAWGLIMWLPVINLVAVWAFTFLKWPNHRKSDDPTP